MIVQKKSPDECGAKYREETAPPCGTCPTVSAVATIFKE
jgi:hypothetical protein